MNDAIEKEIQEKGLTAPRITPADIEAAIAAEVFYTPGRDADTGALPDDCNAIDEALGCLTICVLVLKNGFTVVGKSACASPENFDAELGRKIARQDAVSQIWPLEGYQLRTKLAAA